MSAVAKAGRRASILFQFQKGQIRSRPRPPTPEELAGVERGQWAFVGNCFVRKRNDRGVVWEESKMVWRYLWS